MYHVTTSSMSFSTTYHTEKNQRST